MQSIFREHLIREASESIELPSIKSRAMAKKADEGPGMMGAPVGMGPPVGVESSSGMRGSPIPQQAAGAGGFPASGSPFPPDLIQAVAQTVMQQTQGGDGKTKQKITPEQIFEEIKAVKQLLVGLYASDGRPLPQGYALDVSQVPSAGADIGAQAVAPGNQMVPPDAAGMPKMAGDATLPAIMRNEVLESLKKISSMGAKK